jgi:superfamily II DNA or RNA helicase
MTVDRHSSGKSIVARLVIDNSTSTIQDLSMAEHKKLQGHLSYDPGDSHYTGVHTRKTLLSKHGVFPTGLLPLVDAYLKVNGLKIDRQDNRRAPRGQGKLFKMSLGLTPYSQQKAAVEACAHRGILSIPTGVGKSITMALLVNKFQVKTLIIVPNLGLKLQLTESFKTWFGPTPNIAIHNIDSSSLLKAKDYDMLIIDEAHHAAASTYRKLNTKAWTGIYYRFFFTATPFRSRTEETMLFESIAGQIIYNLTFEDSVKNNLIVPVESYYYEIPKDTVKNLGSTWPSVYNKLVVTNDARNRIISDVLLSLADASAPTLCLVKEIDHGDRLSALTGIPFANGKDSESKRFIEQFKAGKITTLIGTTGVLGEGVDTKPCEFVVIAGLGKSKNLLMQCIGRGVRRHEDKTSCKVIIFKDNSHIWTKRHFKTQVEVLKDEYSSIPAKI